MANAQAASQFDSCAAQPLRAKVHRIESGVSLEFICERTKISRYFLEAIEERAYHRLPGGVFDINYIRQYSESVGCNASDLIADYQAVSGEADSKRSSTPVGILSLKWWRRMWVQF